MKRKAHPRSCAKCRYLGSEDDGNYPEFAISWPACDLVERYQYLKSFPFKKRMPCFRYHRPWEYNWEKDEVWCGIWWEDDMERLLGLEHVGGVYRKWLVSHELLSAYGQWQDGRADYPERRRHRLDRPSRFGDHAPAH